MADHVRDWQRRVRSFENESHKLFAKYETSASRIVELNALVKGLAGLTVDAADYYREAADCLQNGNFRAAIVMAWAGYFSVLMDAFYAAKKSEIKAKYTSWDTSSAEGLRESTSESNLLVATKTLKFVSKSDYRMYDGQLSIRNKCAHPTVFSPSPNVAIGFVDAMVLQTRNYT